jgi:hypothetical protein
MFHRQTLKSRIGHKYTPVNLTSQLQRTTVLQLSSAGIARRLTSLQGLFAGYDGQNQLMTTVTDCSRFLNARQR